MAHFLGAIVGSLVAAVAPKDRNALAAMHHHDQPGAEGTAHRFSFEGISGDQIELADYRGRALLIVNTASLCGFAAQYEALEQLNQTYKDRGLSILGVPSGDFGNQELSTNEEVKAYCDSKFDFTFPLTARQTVIGPNAHPFYKWAEETLGSAARPRWNFHKFLVNPAGRLTDWFSSFTPPNKARFVEAIEAQLPSY